MFGKEYSKFDMSHVWWQHYTNSLTMALGKKSFLIRDILETSRHQQQQQQPTPELNDIPITLQNNPKLLELIFRNRMETLDDHNLITQETNESPTNSSSGDSNELDHNVPKTISPSSIMNHHWLSNDRTLSFSADRSANNHYGLNGHEKFNHSIQSLTPQLYQNLYYYAIQQQINASMVNNFNIGESSGNVLDQLPIESSITIGTQSIAKVLKVKSGIKRESKRKTNEFKVKRSKCRKKMKSLELNIDDPSMVQHEHSKSDWQSEDVECNCEETDDLDNGNPRCAAQSKCRKLRRNRTVFTELQLMGLERRFDSQKYLSTPDRADLARALGLTQLQVKTWYQNRRMKWKKQVMQNGCPYPPTKPKGRPKKDSIPTYGMEFTNSILCPIFASHGPNGNINQEYSSVKIQNENERST